jgi:hypothetical protein
MRRFLYGILKKFAFTVVDTHHNIENNYKCFVFFVDNPAKSKPARSNGSMKNELVNCDKKEGTQETNRL